MRRLLVLLTLSLVLTGSSSQFGQPTSSGTAMSDENRSFEQLADSARKARKDGLVDEAEKLYRAGLARRPDWLEGWASLGVLLFDSDRAAEAIEAFRVLTVQQPGNPEGWAFLGLSQYKAREYDGALTSLTRALTIGMRSTSKLASLAKIQVAFLLNRQGRFDEALVLLSEQARLDAFNRRLEQAFGGAVLRLPYLSDEVPNEYRKPIQLAGKAAVLASVDKLEEARQVFEQLVAEYPDTPQAHYAYGTFLLRVDPPAAIPEFKRELEVTPEHLGAHLRLAMALWTDSRVEEAQRYAERALELDEHSPAALTLLGRILLSEGQVDAAISRLESAYRLVPDSTEILTALQRAYSRAGREEDAARIREAFMQLQRASQSPRPTPGGE